MLMVMDKVLVTGPAGVNGGGYRINDEVGTAYQHLSTDLRIQDASNLSGAIAKTNGDLALMASDVSNTPESQQTINNRPNNKDISIT